MNALILRAYEGTAAVACFTADLDALLAHLRLPARHGIFCRTTNLIERSFEKEAAAPKSSRASPTSDRR